jgi:hypothetical protein
VRPSSSKNSDGSIPSTSSQIGSDHGPAGSVAVITKLPPRPASAGSTIVQTTKNRPSWWRIVGAYRPPDEAIPA